MLNDIKQWVNKFYENNYFFDGEGFVSIINRLAPIIAKFSEAEINYINGILSRILNKYEIKDYYYVVEIFEYEFIPIFE